MKIFFIFTAFNRKIKCLRTTSTKKTFCGLNCGTNGPEKLKSVFNIRLTKLVYLKKETGDN